MVTPPDNTMRISKPAKKLKTLSSVQMAQAQKIVEEHLLLQALKLQTSDLFKAMQQQQFDWYYSKTFASSQFR